MPGRVMLQPKVNYLQGSEVLDVLGIWLYHALKIFIYQACRVRLMLKVVKGHYKGQHQAAITDAVTEALQAFCEQNQVHKWAEEVALPSPGGPVV